MLDNPFIISPFENYSYKKKVCKVCKMDLESYRRTGRLGCSECYVTFRENFKNKGKEEFEDIIFRSLGILKYAKKISSIDALNLLSNVRYGVEMGIIDNIKLKDIQYAAEIVQSGNIQRILSREMTSRERGIERAKMMNRILG